MKYGHIGEVNLAKLHRRSWRPWKVSPNATSWELGLPTPEINAFQRKQKVNSGPMVRICEGVRILKSG